jgi:hypothetical protein
MDTTVDPRDISLDHHRDSAPVQSPPPTPALTTVVPGPPAPAAATASRRPASWPHRGYDPCDPLSTAHPALALFEFDALNNGALVDTQQRTPYPHIAHVVAPSMAPDP